MLLNCGVGEDSWESLEKQRDPTSPSYRKSVLNIHWKNWCWGWNSSTLATWWEELIHLKRPNVGKDRRQEEKGTTEDESVLHIRWPKCWSFSFSISPSNEYSGLISFRMDWLDLCAVLRTLRSLLQHHSSKASILWHSAFFTVQFSHPYMTTGKNHSLD